MQTTVPIVPETLKWAMEWAAIDKETLAKALNVKSEKITDWLNGTQKPTYRQAKELANRCHVAFSQLLLPPPEKIDIPLNDFRRGPAKVNRPSPELVEAIYDALRKRDWWREYRRNEPVPFWEKRFVKKDAPEAFADAILQIIPIQDAQKKASSWQDLLRLATQQIEEAGILVLRQSFVGSNTHRVYNSEEFSGFAIADEVAPVIFVNTRDSIARQTFTLIHELIHVWLGDSVLDANLEGIESPDIQAERFCDQVAAAMLMPAEDFRNIWYGNPYEGAQWAARKFKVSAWAALKRALELNLVSYREYHEALNKIKEDIEPQTQREGGPTFWTTLESRNSRKFTRAVVEAARRGDISAKEMASLLNLNLATALEFMESFSHVPS
ncbi:MAG TPA: ImmA/IrrE family metallo-endopeptidase [Syntrophothermus lipocalidus]|nr:ImmA/IrrE family metallo-endopeptidase [Syntrophothermus lipocalidus]